MRKADDVEALARRAKEASRALARCPTEAKNKALREMACSLRRRARPILAVNREEVAAARSAGKSRAFVDRLALDPGRLE